MKLDPAEAIQADIYSYEDDKPYLGQTWPSGDGVAIILCPDCGELDEQGVFFEINTVYSNSTRCLGCKTQGYMLVGL